MTAVRGFCELAMGKITPEHEIHDDLVEIRDAAERAVALIQQLLAFSRKQVLDLILTDVIMPGLTGPQLVAQIRRGWPDVRTLYMTGYTDRHRFRRCEERDVPILNKPFTSEQLLSAIKNALAVRTSPPLS